MVTGTQRGFQFQLATLFGMVVLVACLITVWKKLGTGPLLGFVGLLIVVFVLSLLRDRQ